MRNLLLICLLWCFVGTCSAADVFERHSYRLISQAVDKMEPVKQLSMEAGARLKRLSKNNSSPCLVIRTNDGNLAKVQVTWGLRKGPEKPVPVLLIERFVTYRSDRPDLTAAVGKDVMLFAGLAFNFDIGQVVPAGQGPDIEFTADAVIKPVGETQIFALNGSLLPVAEKKQKHDPNDHDGVLPQDFSGTWKVNADGRWLGEWRLKVEENGRANGTYTSAESQNEYEMSGQTAALPHNLHLEILLANTQQSVDAYLWTKDKSAMAGTVTLAGRKFGFYATRMEE